MSFSQFRVLFACVAILPVTSFAQERTRPNPIIGIWSPLAGVTVEFKDGSTGEIAIRLTDDELKILKDKNGDAEIKDGVEYHSFNWRVVEAKGNRPTIEIEFRESSAAPANISFSNRTKKHFTRYLSRNGKMKAEYRIMGKTGDMLGLLLLENGDEEPMWLRKVVSKSK